MNLARKIKRQNALKLSHNYFCRKCGKKCKVKDGVVYCPNCRATYGKVKDRMI